MKYLGVVLDSRLSFTPHIEYVGKKASKVLRSLGLLMPNLRGPSQTRRRLYYNVVMSILTYGVPVWGQEFVNSSRKQYPLRRIQRTAALRVICAYRTVSLDAALLLAGFPPFPLMLGSRIKMYHRIAELKRNDALTIRASRLIKKNIFVCARNGRSIWLVRVWLVPERWRRSACIWMPDWTEDVGV